MPPPAPPPPTFSELSGTWGQASGAAVGLDGSVYYIKHTNAYSNDAKKVFRRMPDGTTVELPTSGNPFFPSCCLVDLHVDSNGRLYLLDYDSGVFALDDPDSSSQWVQVAGTSQGGTCCLDAFKVVDSGDILVSAEGSDLWRYECPAAQGTSGDAAYEDTMGRRCVGTYAAKTSLGGVGCGSKTDTAYAAGYFYIAFVPPRLLYPVPVLLMPSPAPCQPLASLLQYCSSPSSHEDPHL